jgi:hypothetical protein
MFFMKLIAYSRIFLLGLMITLQIIANAQVNVVHVDGRGNPGKDGVFYSLPRTVIKVSLKVNKIQTVKGPYSEYADKYLGLTNCTLTNSIEYELDEISMSVMSEPDPEQYYFVELDEKASKENKAVEMNLSELGLLQDAKDVSKSKNLKVTSQQQVTEKSFAEILNPTWFERVDTIIRRLSVDTTNIEQKVFRKASSEKTQEQKAKDAADYILKLDENKLNLLSGYQEISYEKASIEYMCNQLDKLKSEYLSLFCGLTSVSNYEVSFNYIPKAGEQEHSSTICKFSKAKGVVEKSGQGDPITISVEAQGLTKVISEYLKTEGRDDKRIHGFYYCIPDNAIVSVKIGGQTKLETSFAINQLGIITSVPSGSFSSLRLHDNTGSLKSVILE